jgi:hypothetical protein
MILYLVRKSENKYLHFKYGHKVVWVGEELADLYHTQKEAVDAGMAAFDWEYDAESKFDLVILEAKIL